MVSTALLKPILAVLLFVAPMVFAEPPTSTAASQVASDDSVKKVTPKIDQANLDNRARGSVRKNANHRIDNRTMASKRPAVRSNKPSTSRD